MAVRVAINGFGRTGRAAFRAAYETGADIEWVAINDLAEPALLAQLLKHDTVYGPFGGIVEAGCELREPRAGLRGGGARRARPRPVGRHGSRRRSEPL